MTKPASDTKPLALNLVQGGLSHSETLIQKVYPWHSEGSVTSLPPHAVFLCAYDVDVGIDAIPEAAFLIQREQSELWLVPAPSPSMLDVLATSAAPLKIDARLAVVARHEPDQRLAAAALLGALFDARVGFGWPTRHLAGIDSKAFAAVIEKLEQRLRVREAAASAHADAPILIAARKCRMNPEPSATSSWGWSVRCPGTNHSQQPAGPRIYNDGRDRGP